MKSSQVHTNTAEKHGEVHDPNGPPPALVRVIITTDRLNECLSTSSLTLSVSLCYCCIFFFQILSIYSHEHRAQLRSDIFNDYKILQDI